MKQKIIALLTFGLVLSGCGLMNERVVYVDSTGTVVSPVEAEPQRVIEPTQQDMQRRFDARPDEGSAVQNAVIWAQKYEELSVRNNELREQNNKLYLENHRLQREVEKLKLQLEQAKKDLDEANEFLQQMHLELTKWKSDVLGFRDEIRTSQKAQVEALNKILSVLGAEPVSTPESEAGGSSDEKKEETNETS
jgi:hypothetical protein